jgi:hypothetical protein
MKQKIYVTLLLFATFTTSMWSQCIAMNPNPVTPVAISTGNNIVTIDYFSSFNEYSTLSNAVAGTQLRFTSSITTDYFTVRSGAPNGPVLGHGTTPLTINNTYTGTIFLHLALNSSCDGGGIPFRTTTVQNVTNAPPTDISLSATAINENVAANSTVGTFSTTDPNAGDTFTYNLVGGTGSTDNGAFTISGNSLTINASPNFETKSSYAIRVRTMDQGGLFFEKQFTITINNLCEIVLTAGAQTNVSCFGGSNGSATVTRSGGTGGYTQSWSPFGGTAATATGLTAGTYTVTVTDANGCSATQNFTITQPPALSVTPLSQTNVSCNGGNNGAASINTPTSGAGGYTYNWTPGTPTGDGTTSVTGLTAGTWTCTVTDANSCTATQNFTITQPTALAVTAASQTNVTCNGGNNGAASINTPTGGAGGYTYNWTPGTPTGDGTTSVTGLTAGTWTCTVTDANGCTTTQNFTITQPTALAVTAASQSNLSCNGAGNGAASVNVPTGGTPPYTYNWSPGTPSGDGTPSVTGLNSRNWTCTVTDANGCLASQTFTITQPTGLGTSIGSQTNVTCFGGTNGSASANGSGGTAPYTYLWSNGNTTTTITNLTAGTYTLTVTDANGCTTNRPFIITQPAAINTAVTQASGVLTATQAGAMYQWYQCPNTLLSGQTNQTITPTVVGDYKVDVTVAGCTVTSSCATVTLGNEDFEISNNFKLYPNPTQNIVNIETQDLDNASVEVYDINGRQLLSQKLNTITNVINIDNLASGVYMFKVSSSQGTATSKVVKQ